MENCPICGGMGFVTKNVPLGHPDFGKAFPCVCQHETLEARKKAHLYAISNLGAFADKTFDTFLLDRSDLNEKQLTSLSSAYNLARKYAIDPEGWLVFQGGYGSGKTHLAAAIANYRLSLGDDVLLITSPDLLDHLRSTYGPSSDVNYDDLFERVRNVSLLVLDDLGAESSTSWALEKLYQLINHRYTVRLCTIFTTNKDMVEIDPRIRSRLADGILGSSVKIDVPDFRRSDAAIEKNTLFSLNLYSDMVFETFDLRMDQLPKDDVRNLQRAYETALAYAKNPQGWLLFTGVHGCGKTHLAAAIANYRGALGESVVFVTAADLLDYLKAAFNPMALMPLDERFNQLQTAQLLVIDQLNTATFASPWALEKLQQIANYRYLSHLPTVFTTTQKLKELDPMLQSRLLDMRFCQTFGIVAPDYTGGRSTSPRRQERG